MWVTVECGLLLSEQNLLKCTHALRKYQNGKKCTAWQIIFIVCLWKYKIRLIAIIHVDNFTGYVVNLTIIIMFISSTIQSAKYYEKKTGEKNHGGGKNFTAYQVISPFGGGAGGK